MHAASSTVNSQTVAYLLPCQLNFLDTSPGLFQLACATGPVYEYIRSSSIITCSEGGFFNAILSFPADYPNSPPTCRFTSEMWHPNGEH